MSDTSPVVGLLPLDDRPVNTTHVERLGQAAGARVLTPTAMLGQKGAASDVDAVGDWLATVAADCDALVVSINQLVHGGYVPSRRTGEQLDAWLPRLDVLGRIRRARPDLPVYAYVVLMRTKSADDAGTEPSYWASYGRAFAALSAARYRHEHGLPAGEVDRENGRIPRDHVLDFMGRRLQLHGLQLVCLQLVADGVVNRLVVAVEDSTVESLSTTEREVLQHWIGRLGLTDVVACYPGADEVAGTLVNRAIWTSRGAAPTVAVMCAVPGGLDVVAPYEDVPVRTTVEAQLHAAGVRSGDLDSADLVLAVHPPLPAGGDWFRRPDLAAESTRTATSHATALAEPVKALVDQGRQVTVADVATANGGDPVLVTALDERDLPSRMAGYAGWNTAGNTIGSALFQGCARLFAGEPAQLAEHRRAVAHRFVEDWGYQAGVRGELAELGVVDATDAELADRLAGKLDQLAGLGRMFQLDRSTVRLPWGRLFEVDFTLAVEDGHHDG